ncbi:MAG TPA: addiction module protein [Thermoanaerobaculia bacterium]|nr:addiction module protein [Thermoanaerobaculia bacterium]
MSPNVRDLYEKASERSDDSITEAWAKEIERRMADYRAGRIKTISWQQVRAHLHRPNR